MIRIKALFVSCVILAAVFIIFAGCEGDRGPEGAVGPTGPQGPPGDPGPSELNIVAVLNLFELESYDVGILSMSVYNAPSVPKVRLNDEDVLMDIGALLSEGRLAYIDTTLLARTDSAFLEVTYTGRDGLSKAASSEISLPSLFVPIDQFVNITYGGDTEVEWTRSEGAEAYWIFCEYIFMYYDTANVYHEKSLEFDTVLSVDDTSLIVPGVDIFPDAGEVSNVSGFNGLFLIRAVTGPWLSGEANNFTGDAFGLFVGTTDDIWIDVNLGSKAASNSIIKDEFAVLSHRAEEVFAQRLNDIAQGYTTR